MAAARGALARRWRPRVLPLGRASTLQRRCFVLIASICAFILLVSSIFFAVSLEQVLRRELAARGRIEVESLALGVKSGILIEDVASIERAVHIAMADEHVLYARVYDQDQQLLFHARKHAEAGTIAGQVLDDAHLPPAHGTEVLDLAVLVRDTGGEALGSVRVGISLEAIRAEQRRMILNLGLFVAAFLVLGSLIAYRFARSISRPLEQITATIRDISESRDLSKRVHGGAEIVEVRVLEEKFNQLVAEIEASQERLVEHGRLRKELEIASSIQAALLPDPEAMRSPHYEVFAYMKPAEGVGGDYYDAITTDDDRLWLGIGDVSGHGLTSGLYMMMAQSAVASFLRACPDAGPKELVASLNATLHENMRRRFKADDFFTACVLALEPDGRVLHCGRHLPLLVYRQQARACEPIETQGVWLGIVPDIAPMLTEDRFRLAPGDLLFLYTDGLIEARNASSEQFDLPALVQSIERHAGRGLAPDAIGREILTDLGRFMGDRPADDDISLLVVKKA